jgi:predicted RNA-binding Zn ribbon-like protein
MVLQGGTWTAYRRDVSEPFQPAGRAPAPPPLDLVQDFVNTEIPEWARDDVATPALLEDWLRGRKLLEATDEVDGAVFVAARELRDVLRRLALQNTFGEPPSEDLRRDLVAGVSGLALGLEVDAAGRLVPVPSGTGGERALAAIAVVVLEAQAAGTWRRLKACRKESCGWLFYDASRNVSSNWCSMSICGNRTKAAAYRRRKAGR